jgi:hypothetical protein
MRTECGPNADQWDARSGITCRQHAIPPVRSVPLLWAWLRFRVSRVTWAGVRIKSPFAPRKGAGSRRVARSEKRHTGIVGFGSLGSIVGVGRSLGADVYL